MFRKFVKYGGKYKKEWGIGFFCCILEAVFEIMIPTFMAKIIDYGIVKKDFGYILRIGGVILLLSILSFLFGRGCSNNFSKFGNGFAAEIRDKVYQKVQSFSFSNMDHFTNPSLITRLTSDVVIIQNAVTPGVRSIFRAPIMLLSGVVMAVILSRELAVVFFIAIPILGFLLYLVVKYLAPVYHRMQKTVDVLNRVTQENLRGIRVVKAYAREPYEGVKFEEVNQDLKDSSIHAYSLSMMNSPIMQFVMYGTIIAIVWFGGNLIIADRLLVGQLTGFLSYVLQILNSLMLISAVFINLTKARESFHRINEVLVEEVELGDEGSRENRITKGSVRMENVSFKYSKSAKEFVLKDVNLFIQPGETVGILGGTGSSKTSLVQLIPRLYDATDGTVWIDNIPVKDYSLEHLREEVGMVLQKNTLFSGTITENLRWGNEDATVSQMRRACDIACASEFIEQKKDGYEFHVEEGGNNLSGGQKQRLCIARALLKEPKILIFDDSTSALDMNTEKKLYENLKEEYPHTTKIIIAQRITSVSHADKIVILNDGMIDETGTHEELLSHNQIYQEIYYSQQKGGVLND
ncbi:ABC transporter ATP-binding protein [Clostridium sp. HBUAS56010]|uniref:ABC transporter ATP-binding protein n=1 Tax=Clostridium sp. HBUAS56010 TaxID=2571127 RepID=UPI001177B75E|nr:ABC transporter ATP-binding protein [Clostridium sp. HBUAS56010]